MLYLTLNNGKTISWHVGENLLKNAGASLGGYRVSTMKTAMQSTVENTLKEEVKEIQADGDELELIYSELNLHPFKKRVVTFYGDQAKSIVANILT